MFGGGGYLDRYPLVDQALAKLGQLEVDDLTDLPGGQALEDDHSVDAIEELGAKHPLELLVDLFLRVLVPPLDLIGLIHNARPQPNTPSNPHPNPTSPRHHQ